MFAISLVEVDGAAAGSLGLLRTSAKDDPLISAIAVEAN